MVIFSISLLTSVSEYSVMARVCSSKKENISLILKFYVFYCLSQNVMFFLRAMISSPISSIIFCSLLASRSFICRVLYLHFQLFQAFLCIFIYNLPNTLHQYRNDFIFLLNVSFIAVSTAACKSSSLIVLAGQSIPIVFLTLLTHLQTVDLHPLLFHFILRNISPQWPQKTILDKAYFEL